MHLTYLKKGQDPLLSAVQCTTCCNRYHCTYCNRTFLNSREIHTHIEQHMSSAVPYEDVVIVKCGLGCRQSPHFHCCYCMSTIMRRKELIKHLYTCKNKASRQPLPLDPVTSPATAPPSPATAPPSPAMAPPSPATAPHFTYNEKEHRLEAPAQVTVQRHSHGNRAREVQVTGTAESCCLADRVTVRVSVGNSKESVNDVSNSISRRLDYILQTLRQHGVKDEDTSVRRHLHREDDLYHMDVEITVSFSDFEKMERVCSVLLEKLEKSVCVGTPQFYHSAECLSQLRRRACVSAVENAQQKAWEVSSLLGQSLGPPLLVREEETSERRNEEEEEEEDGVRSHPQPPRRPTVTAFSRVYVSFSLRDKRKR